MIKIRQIAINIISGGAGYLVPMVVNLLTTPFLLSKLGEEAYGIQVIANVIVGYLVVADMGLDIPITQKISSFYAKQDDNNQSNFLATTIKIYFLIGFSGALILIGLTDFIIEWLIIPDTYIADARYVFYLSAFGFLGSILGMWGKAVFNGLHRYDIANGVNIICNVLAVGLGLVLIFLDYGIVGFMFARMLGFFLSALIYLKLVAKHIVNFRFKPFIDTKIWLQLRGQIGFGFLLRISGMFFSRMDQTLIGVWIGISFVTIYSFPILMATTLSGLVSSITHFIFPMVSSMDAAEGRASIGVFFIKTSKYIALLSTLVFIPFIVLGDKVISLWISEEIARESHDALIILSCSFYLTTCLNVAMNSFLVGIGQLRKVAYFNFMRGLCLLIGFLLLIKPIGIEGAAAAYVFANLVDVIYIARMAKKNLMVRFDKLLVDAYLTSFLLGAMLGSILYGLRDYINSWIEIILSMSLFALAFITLAFVTGALGKQESDLLRTLVRTKK